MALPQETAINPQRHGLQLETARERDAWQLLLYYNVYRFGLACFLGVQGYAAQPSATNFEWLFVGVPVVGIALLSLITFFNIYRRSPSLLVQTHSTFLVDILFIGVIVLSGELRELTAVALYVTVAATAIVFRLKVSLFYAALCSFLVLYPRYVEYVYEGGGGSTFYFPIVIALGLFAISYAVGYLAQKTRLAETLIRERGIDIANLNQINQLVVEQLDVGIVVLDKTLDIRQINGSASQLIGTLISGGRITGKMANYIIRVMNSSTPSQFTTHVGSNILEIGTVPLRNGLLLTVENKTELTRRIRKSRLASVGRMASSIAHEIRNPLNAINHAAQLLAPIGTAGSRFSQSIDKIRDYAQKIDGIVESVLQRSRTGQAELKRFKLGKFLNTFTHSFHSADKEKVIRFKLSGNNIDVVFDPIQFEQILTNLCENRIELSQSIDPTLEINLHSDKDELGNPYLEISSFGRPVESFNPASVFEPTGKDDEGDMGLFLVKEICTINGADVTYISDTFKSGFRIAFLSQEELTH